MEGEPTIQCDYCTSDILEGEEVVQLKFGTIIIVEDSYGVDDEETEVVHRRCWLKRLKESKL